MKHTTKTLVIGAALAGLLGGTAARANDTMEKDAKSAKSNTKAWKGKSAGDDAKPSDKKDGKHGKTHACKGQNKCKGKGGCKTGDNGCTGKNSCKGKGGCATDGTKMPE